MSEVQSAISQVAPSRGRRPVVLKDGTSLADARKASREAVVNAKTAYRDAKNALRDADKKSKTARIKEGAADKALAKVREQRFATTAEKKLAISTASATAKSATAERKAAERASADALRAADKAQLGVTKAEESRLKVEEKYQASKSKN